MGTLRSVLAFLLLVGAYHSDVQQPTQVATPPANGSSMFTSFDDRQVVTLPFGTQVTVGQATEGQVVFLPFGTVLREALWNRLALEVCWDPVPHPDQRYRDVVRQSVEGTWQAVSRLQFTGWTDCSSDDAPGIHVLIADDEPHTEALGIYIDQRPRGMVLNATFERTWQRCQQQSDFCLWAISVHEFGHAIGFAHEATRDDLPKGCTKDLKSQKGTWNVTEYDAQSVMNYCNTNWNNDGHLSQRDIDAVTRIYGAR